MLGSCVHPHRPWSKSHPLSDGGEVATAVRKDGRQEKSEAISDTGAFTAALHNHIHWRLSSRVLPPPNGAINPAFHFFSLSCLTCRRDGDRGGFDVGRQGRRDRLGRSAGFCTPKQKDSREEGVWGQRW